jgi:hypothetical protein
LQTTLQEILNFQGQDVIELHAGFVEHSDANESSNSAIGGESVIASFGRKLESC